MGADVTSGMPLWAGGALAALLMAAAVVAFQWAVQKNATGHAARGALLVTGALLAWALLPLLNMGDQSGRRALEARASELAARSLTPGSPLACLDPLGNPALEAACEKTLFATPDVVAAALAYSDARLQLLVDGLELAKRDRGYREVLDRLRLALEHDRFGFVAQALAARGCQDETCALLKSFKEDSRLAANVRERTFDANVVLYAATWPRDNNAYASAGGPALAPAGDVPVAAQTGASATPRPAQAPTKFDFPSAASIPAISIMNPEPATPAHAAEAKPDSRPDSKPARPAQAARKPPPREQAPAYPAQTLAQPAAPAPRPLEITPEPR